LYSTYLGGTNDDAALAVGVDTEGNIIAGGQTRSIDFPFTNPLPQTWGYGDAFVVKLAGTSAAIVEAVNGASYAGGPVAPGENITLFGSGIGPASLAYGLTSGGHLGTGVAGFEVEFDGIPAPMIYASINQTSVMVPYEVAGKTSTTVQIMVGGIPISSTTLRVNSAAPGIYTVSQNGLGQGAILNSDLSPNSVVNPARAGSAIAVYLTSAGQTSPGGVTGALASADGSSPQHAVANVTATVGGNAAAVLYAGSAPTLVEGIAQVNIQLPQETGAGTWSLVITYSDAAGKTYETQAGVTVAVKKGAERAT
jgi:uncharacterized protein (TIGR03437 family)